MNRFFKWLCAVLGITTVVACNNQAPATKTANPDKDLVLIDSMHFSHEVLSLIRKHNNSPLEPFHYSLSKILRNDTTIETEPTFLPGIVFTEENARSYNVVFQLKDDLKKMGYYIFMLENNFGIGTSADYIAVLQDTDMYSILKKVGTAGTNYGIENDSLIKVIEGFNTQCDLELIGASGDWCEFIIHRAPADWLKFAREVEKVCPDVVEQGTGSVEALAEEMKTSNRLYFWWD